MNDIFIRVLNNALSASFLIAAVFIVRLLIKKAPKWVSCALWGLVAFKLMVPIDIESVLSLIPSPAPIPADIAYTETPHIESGIPLLNHAVNPVLETSLAPQPVASANPMQIVIAVCTMVWIIGMAGLFFYSLGAYLILRRRVAASKKIFENVYVCDEVKSPFILGIVRPRIYLPSGLLDKTRECVLEHEKAHMKRLDFLWKPLGFFILMIYWFQPLCWVSYILLCKDIEHACDEKVTADKDRGWRIDYCQALIDCNVKRRVITACPIAFGEVGIRDRIKSVLRYKKPALGVTLAAVAVGMVTAVCFMTNPKDDDTINVADGAATDGAADTDDGISGANSDGNGTAAGATADVANGAAQEADKPQTVDQTEGADGLSRIIAEGSFDNIMGYAGSYVYYEGYPPEGYYYAADGMLLAHVWGCMPEDTGIVDLDWDGKNELIAPLMSGDGGTDVVVFKEFEGGIREAFCLDLLDQPYDSVGPGSLAAEYLKDTNEVKISYYVAADEKMHDATYYISIYPLTWWGLEGPGAAALPVGSGSADYWNDERDWPCGTISELLEGTIDGTAITISQKYFVNPEDTVLIEKLGLTDAYFPNGFAVEPVGNTVVCTISEDCEYIFIDKYQLFENDDRVETYDKDHVATKDYEVFKEYAQFDSAFRQQLFFYRIEDGKVKTIYETWLP